MYSVKLAFITVSTAILYIIIINQSIIIINYSGPNASWHLMPPSHLQTSMLLEIFRSS